MSEFKIDAPDTWKCPECGDNPVHQNEAKEVADLFTDREQTEVKCDSCMEELMAEASGDSVEFVEMWNYV